MKDNPEYTLRTFPSGRQFTMDVGKIGGKHHIKALVEIDITEARKSIRGIKTTEQISFTSGVLKCISQAISEHREVHALRKGRKKLIIFDQIDMSIVVKKWSMIH